MAFQRFLIAVAVAALAHGCTAGSPIRSGGQAEDVTLNQVIARTTEAMGGRRDLARLRNLRLKAEWIEGGSKFTGDYRAIRDGRMRIDVFIDGKRVFSEGLDARGAWEQPGEGAKVADVGVASKRALEHGVAYRFHGVWSAHSIGNRVALEDRELVGGVRYYVLKLTFRDGFETFFYVNPATWLIERQRDVRAYHPSSDTKKITVETVHDGFADLCGVKVPARSRDVDLKAGKTLTTNRLAEGQCNIPDAQLDMERPS